MFFSWKVIQGGAERRRIRNEGSLYGRPEKSLPKVRREKCLKRQAEVSIY